MATMKQQYQNNNFPQQLDFMSSISTKEQFDSNFYYSSFYNNNDNNMLGNSNGHANNHLNNSSNNNNNIDKKSKLTDNDDYESKQQSLIKLLSQQHQTENSGMLLTSQDSEVNTLITIFFLNIF